jgi:transcriptional regulator with XRE-family HTH domain
MAKDICVRFGARIRSLRKAKKWTQTYLSVHSGLSRTFISDVELGRKEPCLRSLETFADSLGVSMAQLMSRL